MQTYTRRYVVVLLALVLGGCASHNSSALSTSRDTESGQECASVEFIETVNEHGLKQVAHVTGDSAKLLLALDPDYSYPELSGDGYRDEHYVDFIKERRALLKATDVDEVVIWRLPMPDRMGVAMPFNHGCAIQTIHGEPDSLDKLVYMNKAYELIMKYGLDDPSVKASIKELLTHSDYNRHYSDEMIDVVIGNVREITAR